MSVNKQSITNDQIIARRLNEAEARRREYARIKAGGCLHPHCPQWATRRVIDLAGNHEDVCLSHMRLGPDDRVRILRAEEGALYLTRVEDDKYVVEG